MDPEKNQNLHLISSSTNSACFRRERLKGLFLNVLLYVSCAFALFVVFHSLFLLYTSAYLEELSSLLHVEGGRLGHRLTMKEREELFLSIPNSENAINTSRVYATHPHLAGSQEDLSDAKIILKLFQTEFGIHPPVKEPIFSAGSFQSRRATLRTTSRFARKPSAWIDTYYPVMNTPLNRSVEILDSDGRAAWSADLVEDGDPLDEDAHRYKDAVPTWHGLSKDGIAEGHLVFANYGRKEDYDELVSGGADLNGKIVIVRYGELFRGLKVKGAQELGAAGVLIYSDPRDDGFVTIENRYTPYPAGPARNPTSVERGTVEYISSYSGDPTTPGYPAYENSTRVEATNIPTIPSLPLSWQNAERLLEEIEELYSIKKNGRRVLSGKASQSRVKLVNHVDTKVTPIWNVMASIPGRIRDEVIIIGCHRDAWVMGAADPTSGTVSLQEIVRGFGALLKKGWRPLRTVVIASWDAEEYGFIGSTEWGEDFASWISRHAVVYINTDVSASGSRLKVAGSPSLAHLVRGAALDIPHPTSKGKTLWDARTDSGPFVGDNVTDATINAERSAYIAEKETQAPDISIFPLGSGSDYTVFLHRLGIASLDEGFVRTPTDAVYPYHSVYDSQRFEELYADPGFHRHVAVAQHLGLLALRLIDSIIVPLNTSHYALELHDYLDKVQALVPDLPVSAETLDLSYLRNSIQQLQSASLLLDKEKAQAEKQLKSILKKLLRRHKPHKHKTARVFKRVADWVLRVLGVQPHYHLKTDEWEEYLELVDLPSFKEFSRHIFPGFPVRELIKAVRRVKRANQKIITFERGFISENGIKSREWYRHLGVAPGKWLGYGATTFPALTEALTLDNNVTSANEEARRLAELLNKLTHHIVR